MSTCRIVYNEKGVAEVKNENGTSSKLYNELSSIYGETEALKLWAITTTSSFDSATNNRNINDDVSVDEVVSYVESLFIQEQNPLTKEDEFELLELVSKMGFTSLIEFRDSLNDLLSKNEKYSIRSVLIDGSIDSKSALNSGIYSYEELKQISSDVIIDALGRINKTLEKSLDFEVSNRNDKSKYKNPNKKTIVGSFEMISDEDVLSELTDLIDNFSDKEEINQKVLELPYEDFIERFKNDVDFHENIVNRLNSKKRIPLVYIMNGNIVNDNSDTFITLLNTLRTDINFNKLEARLNFIKNIPEDVWKDEQSHVYNVLKRIENNFIDNGIDVLGLSESVSDRDKILFFIDDISSLLEKLENNKIKEIDILNFAKSKDLFFGKEKISTEVISVDNNYKTYNLLRLESTLSDSQLFDDYGLIKVYDNLYHRVDINSDKSELYEYLYQGLLSGEVKLNLGLNKKELRDAINKPSVLSKISDYINSKKLPISVKNNELYSLYTEIFPHNIKNKSISNAQNKIGSITKDNHDYLKTDFISDFYSYVLKEKSKDSFIYRNVLKNFKISNKGIDLKDTIQGLDFLPENIKEDLENYIRLRKDSYMDYLLKNNTSANEGLTVVNLEDSISEYQKEYSLDKGYVITEFNLKDFIKVNGLIYKKKLSNNSSSLYAPIDILNDDDVYYNTDPKVLFKESVAEKILSKYDKSINDIDINEIKRQSYFSSPLFSAIRDGANNVLKSLSDNKAFNENLIKFIKSKGIDVITDENEIKRVLSSSGFNSIHQMAFNANINETKNIKKINQNRYRVGYSVDDGSRIRTPDAAYNTAISLKNRVIKQFRKEFPDSKLKDDQIAYIENKFDVVILIKEDYTGKTNVSNNQVLGEVKNIESIDVSNNKNNSRITDEDKRYFLSRLEEEISRGSEDTLGYTYDDIYKYISTPEGEILGFEKDGKIYLDNKRLNRVTTLHELVHVWQSLLKIKGNQGDSLAKEILEKRNELFSEEADYWMLYHLENNNENNIESLHFDAIDGEVNFNKWKGDNKLVALDEIQDVKNGEPVVIEAFHGTTNNFYEFNSSKKGTIDGHLGRVNYFSSDYADSLINYTSEGSDFKNRINYLSEEILSDLEMFSKEEFISKYDISEEDYEDVILNETEEDLSKEIATDKLSDGDDKVLEFYIKLNNPVVLGKKPSYFNVYDFDNDLIDKVANEVADENDISIEEAKNDYYYEINERLIELNGGNIIYDALEDALISNGYPYGLSSEILGDMLYDDVVDLNEVNNKIRESNNLENYNGDFAINQVVSDFFKNLGFDGIILTNVSNLFKGMNLRDNVSHIHVFDDYVNQIKLSDGSNVTFDENTRDFRYQIEQDKNSPLKEIGIDLTSVLYSKRSNETNEQWRDRIIDEVEAFIVSPEISNRLSELEKENHSLWKKITNFIKNLSEWLNAQLGLSDYKGKVSDMTKDEYVSALGNSILKDDYDNLNNDINIIASLKDSGFELYIDISEENDVDLLTKIDSCNV